MGAHRGGAAIIRHTVLGRQLAIFDVQLDQGFGMFADKSDRGHDHAFVVSAGTFAVMSVFGMVTKRDLTSVGRIAYMALIGLIIATIVSFFWHNSMLAVAINYIGVLVFVALTAYDTQKLQQMAIQIGDNPALAARMSVVGSLVLYLDFINLFLFIVQIMGGNRRR